MTNNIRTLTRGIWTGVKEFGARDVVEKKSIVNILVAFAVSTKHYLREEYSYDHEDLKDLIGHLSSFSTPSSNRPLNMQNGRNRASFKLTAHDYSTPTNIPIELSYYIATYLNSINSRGLVESAVLSTMHSGN
jgi:putative membrane protein